MRADEFFGQVAIRPPFTKLHPKVAAFFKNYLAGEKVLQFNEQYVVNTHFPPFPSAAFDRLADNFAGIGNAGNLYSVTLAVTNRCSFNCWHCYNAGRSQQDLPVSAMTRLARSLRQLGAVMVTLTGGEPLLRDDLEEIAAAFDRGTCLIVGTTGDGLTRHKALRLRAAGVFGMGISLDSDDEDEHDRRRGRKGAFRSALSALALAAEAGLYPYVVSVATHENLDPDRFLKFLRFAGTSGALEVHLLEPSLTGRLSGRTDVALTPAERRRIIEYQRQVAGNAALPVLSSFTYLEGPDAFGCGAGLTHLYIDGAGEVCPCNLVPLSFGNVADQELTTILDRLRQHFCRPRSSCVGRILAPRIPAGALPTTPEVSHEICTRHLPRRHAVPRFFTVRSEQQDEVGSDELREAYDGVHPHYDEYWLTEAAGPIHALVDAIDWSRVATVFEAGSGTGYGTALLARRARSVVGADLSPGMLQEAGLRLAREGLENVRLITGDALELLDGKTKYDLVFTSWVLGYIPLVSFFTAARYALKAGGQLAFVIHRENSPQEALEIFAELVARRPEVLLKRIAFDFPRGAGHVRDLLEGSGFYPARVWEGAITFRYDSPDGVLEHLLKSGAGTAFYEAIDPVSRPAMTDEFLRILGARRGRAGGFEVTHDYVACVARLVDEPPA
jgi:MoaA/NifB/PqqE/SkfB family radical SAM enzyme/protein-L-isoaspartate O-methyltransferase